MTSDGVGARVEWVAVGPPATAALADRIAAAQAGDRLAPVTVVVASAFAGLGLRRAVTLLLGGLVNVRFLVAARLAELLGAPRLAAAGRRPLTRAARAEAVRGALAADPGPFGDVAVHPATVRAVERAFAELRRAGPAATAALARGDDRARHLAGVLRRVEGAVADCYDDHDLHEAAAAAVRASPGALADVGHVVVHLPRQATAAQQGLLDALARADRLSVLLGCCGDAEADAPSLALAARLGAAPPAPPTPTRSQPTALPPLRPQAGTSPPASPPRPRTVVLVAPDPDVEVRAVVGELAARLEAGAPLYRMAVVYRSPRPYALLLHDHLAAGGIPFSGPAVHTLAHSAAGRVLLGLLRLRVERFSRSAVTGWLSCAPVLEHEAGDPAPAPRWDALSRAMGVVAGEQSWRDATARHQWVLAHRLQRLEAAGEDDAAARRARVELDHVRRLAAFVDELTGNASPPVRVSWTASAEWARRMLRRYLGGEGHRHGWPDDEIEAARAVDAAVAGLAALDRISGPPDAAAFALVLEEQLQAPVRRHGRFGDGVFVGRVQDAACLDVDTLFVVGMAEGVLPERHRPDPLLGDTALGTPASRRAEERRDYLWALAGAAEHVLSFAQADPRAQRERFPSRWLLDAASHAAGRRLYPDDLISHPPAPWLRRVPSFPALLLDGASARATAASAQDVRLGALAVWTAAGGHPADHPLLRHERRLAVGLDVATARRAPRLTRWNGLVGPLAGAAGVFDEVQSPTGLQAWATCPRRFLFERVLRVAETPEPEDELDMSPIERGNLVHLALERFLAEVPPRSSPAQPWSPDERAHLGRILDDLFADAERRGITGRPLLWRAQRRRIRRDVLEFLDHDEACRVAAGVVPVAGELSFGLDADGLPPVEVVTTTGRKVRFRGRIDRVDRSPDGRRLVVLDYKTGSAYPYGGLDADPVKAGRLLQLPVYALAARAAYGDADIEAAYWFVGEKAGYRRIPVALDARTTGRLHDVLDAIGAGVDAGVFPANPGGRGGRGGHEHCTFCPYDRVCPGDRQAVWERVRLDPTLAPYRRLEPAHPADTDAGPDAGAAAEDNGGAT